MRTKKIDLIIKSRYTLYTHYIHTIYTIYTHYIHIKSYIVHLKVLIKGLGEFN
jgi:hypothetical protein